MTDNDKKINNIIMQEIGLEIGHGNRIYDQDTGMPVRINGYDVVAPNFYRGKQSIEFDPYNNRKMMGQLFSYFLEKRSEETGIDVLAYYDVNGSNKSGKIECRLSDNTIIRSKEYTRDSLKYTDIIIQMNGGNTDDLKEFDTPMVKETVKKNYNKRRI